MSGITQAKLAFHSFATLYGFGGLHLCGFGFLPLGIRIPTVRYLIEPLRSASRRSWLGL